jgi:hypothetical protein
MRPRFTAGLASIASAHLRAAAAVSERDHIHEQNHYYGCSLVLRRLYGRR